MNLLLNETIFIFTYILTSFLRLIYDKWIPVQTKHERRRGRLRQLCMESMETLHITTPFSRYGRATFGDNLGHFQFMVPRGWDKLFLSVVSVETGKTVAKSSKAAVHGGTCQWTETFSESIWVYPEDASKEPEECLYKISVSMGSVRSGILGEVILNLADYLNPRDSGPLSLPLKKCNHGTILQVKIQCSPPKIRSRERKSWRDSTYHHEDLQNIDEDKDIKSDGYDNMLNKSVASSSSSHLGMTSYADELGNREASLSASGSHRSSDSGESPIGRANLSPISSLNGGAYMGRQESAGSHISPTSGAGPGDESSRSNQSSFNSRASGSSFHTNNWQEITSQTSALGTAPLSLRPSDSSKDLLEAAEETIEELQDEAKMWERHSQKLKLDLEMLKKESSDKSKHQANLEMELSAACTERDSLKQEVEQLKSSLKELIAKQNITSTAKIDKMIHVQRELEDEIRFQKETNANLTLQMKKTQEANIELVSILQELEETIEKQNVEIANHSQNCHVDEQEEDPKSHILWERKLSAKDEEIVKLEEKLSDILNAQEEDPRSQTVLDIEAEWENKLSAKEEEIIKLEEKLFRIISAQRRSELDFEEGDPELTKEIEVLKAKVQELERDCTELTEENLELMFQMKESKNDSREGNTEINISPDSSELKIGLLKQQINYLEEEEEEPKEKDMISEDLTVPLKNQIKSLEEKCSDLEFELQHFKEQACHLDIELQRSQAQVKEKIQLLTELQQDLEALQETDLAVEPNSGTNIDKEMEIEDLKACLALKEEEIDVLEHSSRDLEDMISIIKRENGQLGENLAIALRENSVTSKCLDDVRHDLLELTRSMESQVSANKMLERKSLELESSRTELEIHLSELEVENVQLSELTSDLEAQLRHLTNENESTILEVEDSRSLIMDLKDELVKQQNELETQKSELKQKLQEALEETEHVKRSNSKLQETVESLIEECSSLQKLNGDLQRQKSELCERSTHLEIELNESQKKAIDFCERVEFLELALSTMQKDIDSKEKSLLLEIESIFQEHQEHEEKISQAHLILNQMESVKAFEVENFKRQIALLTSQLSSTHEEQESMASDALQEAFNLRLDKSKLESRLQEAHAKVKLFENKVQGLVDSLNASKQSEEMLMADIERMQRQMETVKTSEEKFRRTANELELQLKASDYEKEQVVEEVSSLRFQLQKISHLQDELLALKSSLHEAKVEKGKLEESLHSVSKECEEMKTERVLFMEKLSNMQKALQEGEGDRRSRNALEEKLLKLEGDLSAREASYAHEAELKNELNRMKRANSGYQRKIQSLEEEKDEFLTKSHLPEEELMLKNEINHDEKVSYENGIKTHDTKPDCMEQSLDLGANQQEGTDHMENSQVGKEDDLKSRIHTLENELAKALETNNMYKGQLTSYLAKRQMDDADGSKVSEGENETKSNNTGKIASLEAELKEMEERYLNMSLQYAEVQASREELVMQLKSMKKEKRWFS